VFQNVLIYVTDQEADETDGDIEVIHLVHFAKNGVTTIHNITT